MSAERKTVSKEIKEKVVIDWRLGEMTQREIAKKYDISAGYVARLVKGSEQDCKQVVSKGIEYNQELAKFDDRMVNAIEREVLTKSAMLTTLNHYAMANANEAMTMEVKGMRDLNQRAEVILKTKETVAGKSPETAIQINNNDQPRPTKINVVGV